MLPPDDDYQDEAAGLESGPDEAQIREVLAHVPVDFYERMAPLLQLCAVANFLLLGRPHDPAPQAIVQLTGFDLAAAARVSRLRDSGSLGCLLLQEPTTLYDFLLVGQLVYESPLLEAVRQLLATPDSPISENTIVAENLRAFVVELSETILPILGRYLGQNQAGAGPDNLRLRHLQLESIFARLASTLVPVQLPMAAFSAGSAAEKACEDGLFTFRFTQDQQAALLLALEVPAKFAPQSEQRFERAVATLPGQVSAAVLRQRLHGTSPGETLRLTLGELCQLYQLAQLCALALIADLLEDQAAGLVALPLELTLQHCAELEQFVQLVQTTFPTEPALLAARREVEQLAALL